MSAHTIERVTARERLLAAAEELFYEEGVNTVGIDRIIERAGVAKASLYKSFGSKDELIRAYLKAAHARTQERMERELAAHYSTAGERLVGVFEVQDQIFAEPNFRGCAFIGASAESASGGAVDDVVKGYRTWLRSMFVDLAKEAGAPDAEGLARKLVLLFDGAGISAWIDRDAGAALAARDVAAALVGAALGA